SRIRGLEPGCAGQPHYDGCADSGGRLTGWGTISFHTVASDGAVRSQSEVGFWGVSGDIYFRIFRGWVMLDGMKLANPGDPGHYDAYHVEMLNSGHFRYRHVETGRVYTVRKMPKDFSLPIVLDERNDSPLKFEF
ncbi:MAG: hypothetical protein ACPHN3_10520, partial [Spongiibacter sp.]